MRWNGLDGSWNWLTTRAPLGGNNKSIFRTPQKYMMIKYRVILSKKYAIMVFIRYFENDTILGITIYHQTICSSLVTCTSQPRLGPVPPPAACESLSKFLNVNTSTCAIAECNQSSAHWDSASLSRWVMST